MEDQYLADGRRVGSRAILSSNNVVEAPSRVNNEVPVPSVYSDERGSIHNFVIGGQRLNLLHTRSGVMRSGDLHKDSQHDFVFRGKVKVSTLQEDGTTSSRIYGKNEYIRIPPYTPHIFDFLEETVLAEWWESKFHAWFYLPYRQLVERSFCQANSPGRFKQYIVKSWKDPDCSPIEAGERANTLSPSFLSGLLAGTVIGFIFAIMLKRKH